MAEAVLFNLATDVLKLADSITYSKNGLVCGVRDELDNLKDTVETIRDVLLDAEKKQWHSNQVENWLTKLKDVLYDVQDLLDDVATEDLRRRVTPGNKMWKAVRIFFSKSNQLAHRLKVANEIQELWKRLDKIKKDREFHSYEHQREESMAIARGKKENLLPDTKIIVREEDKKKIKQLLFASSPSQSVSFVAIVGKGGLGKTALARLVYNDGEVKEHFEPKMWVCVSDVFYVNLIIKEILKSANCPNLENKHVDQLPSLLQETLGRKKYLLVLDDLWNTDRDKWVMLGDWLEDGLQGSKILITTRNHRVVEITSTKSIIYEPHGLSDDKSWDLFRKMAFGDGVESLDPKLEEMGRDIVKKCTGVPLAIRTIGGLLCGKNKDEWLRYKVHELPKIPEIDVDGGIMQVLKFSYDHLPSCLKNCFAYCSLFPKDYVYEKDTMIHLWVAQGFIESCNEEDNLEKVANNYLSELLCGSFLDAEFTIKNGYGREVERFKMQDLMHDLAQKVAGGECKIVNLKGNNDRGIRHASFISKTFSEEKVLSLLKTSKLRTMLSLKGVSTVRNFHKVFSNCGHCRALYLDYTYIPLPPSSLGKLKKLRFLHIFANPIQSLPYSITNLVNLQTLKLSFCMHLQTFPRDLRKLVNLRHLVIDGCHSLSRLPPLSELPSLRTLSLKFLLALRFIQHTSDPKPSNTTSPFFQSLERLQLLCCKELEGWCTRRQEMGAHQKHRSDNSRSSFPKLQFMCIFGCPHLNSIPSFPQVEYLATNGTKMLEQQLMAIPNCPSEGTVEATFIPFPELKYLELGNIDMNLEPFMLKTLLRSASNLEYMSISNFDLRSLSCEMQHLSLLKELNIWYCEGLDLSCQEDEHGTQWQCLMNLRVLTITGCSNLMALPKGIQHVTTLQSLKISEWSRLRCLLEWIGHFSLLEKLELSYCQRLKHIPYKICDLTRLKKLIICYCPLLDRRCLADVHIPVIVWEDGESYVPGPLLATDDDSSDWD